VAQITLKRVARAVWLFYERQHLIRGCLCRHEYVVLDNEIVPIEYPDRTIRPYFSVYWAKPLVRAGHQVPSVVFLETGAIRLDDGIVDQPYRRLSDESHLIPIRFGIISCSV